MSSSTAPPVRRWAAVLLLASVTLGGMALAQSRRRQVSTPGDFAYYLLSLSWSPAFCLSSPGSAECSGPRRYGFIVNIYFYEIDTPLREFLVSQSNVVRHCQSVHAALQG